MFCGSLLPGRYGVPLGVGVLGEESGFVGGDDSFSTSGLNGSCLVCCRGAIEVVSESIVDAVLASVPTCEDGVGDGDLLLRRLATEEPSSTVAGFGFIFVGVLGLDLWVEDSVDPSSPLLERQGLLRADEDLVLTVTFALTSFPSLNFRLISSAVASRFCRFSSTATAGSTAVKGGLGGPFIAPPLSVSPAGLSSLLFFRC